MRRQRILLSLFIITLLFAGCTKDDEPNKAELLKGTWVNTLINGQALLTNDMFVMELKSDLTEMYAIGFQLDENNRSWEENSNYTYSIVGDTLIINGTDILDNTFHIVFYIQSLTHETLTMTVPEFKMNDTLLPNNNTYTFKRVTNDYSSAFTGIWYGHCTTQGNADSLYHYWEYAVDGSFSYYYQDENRNWKKKTDNGGRYFLYGDLMASNYSNDLLSGGTGQVFECWNFTIDGNKMVWTGLRENNVTITYEMEKVNVIDVSYK